MAPSLRLPGDGKIFPCDVPSGRQATNFKIHNLPSILALLGAAFLGRTRSFAGSDAHPCIGSHPGVSLSPTPPGGAPARPTVPSPLATVASGDRKFMVQAAEGGLAEVEMGRLAVEKASSPDVKSFGQHMVDDHTRANADLTQLAGKKGVTLPSEVGAKEKALEKKLSTLSGDAFDRAYVAAMLKDHKADVAEFESKALHAKDPDVAAFASRTLPTLREHLERVQGLSKKTAP